MATDNPAAALCHICGKHRNEPGELYCSASHPVRVSDPIATIRATLIAPGNDWADALTALDWLAAALAQAERDRDLYGRALARIGELNPALLAGGGDSE